MQPKPFSARGRPFLLIAPESKLNHQRLLWALLAATLVCAPLPAQEGVDLTPAQLDRLQALPPKHVVYLLELSKFKPSGAGESRKRSVEHAKRFLDSAGARTVLSGNAAKLGFPIENPWDKMTVVRYSSARRLIETWSDPSHRDARKLQRQGLEKTLVYVCTEVPTPEEVDVSSRKADWFVRPAGDADGPFVMLNLLAYKSQGGRATYLKYASVATDHILRRGGKLQFLLTAHTPLVSEREWEDVALVAYPSGAAIADMIQDPAYRAVLPYRTEGLLRTEVYPFRVDQDLGLPQ